MVSSRRNWAIILHSLLIAFASSFASFFQIPSLKRAWVREEEDINGRDCDKDSDEQRLWMRARSDTSHSWKHIFFSFLSPQVSRESLLLCTSIWTAGGTWKKYLTKYHQWGDASEYRTPHHLHSICSCPLSHYQWILDVCFRFFAVPFLRGSKSPTAVDAKMVVYSVTTVVRDMGWIDYKLNVPPSCPVA